MIFDVKAKRIRPRIDLAPGWNEARLELLTRIFRDIKSLGRDDLILVEGKNDLRSLRRIGVESKIITESELRRGRSISPPSQTRNQRIILLPDFDKKGRQNMRKWQKALQRTAKVDDSVWRKLLHVTKGGAGGVEGLSALAVRFGLIRGGMWLDPDEQVS